MAVPAGAPTSKRQASAPGAYEVEIGAHAKRPSSAVEWRATLASAAGRWAPSARSRADGTLERATNIPRTPPLAAGELKTPARFPPTDYRSVPAAPGQFPGTHAG
jgi:hypothetical protein